MGTTVRLNEAGAIDEDGRPTDEFQVTDCTIENEWAFLTRESGKEIRLCHGLIEEPSLTILRNL